MYKSSEIFEINLTEKCYLPISFTKILVNMDILGIQRGKCTHNKYSYSPHYMKLYIV